MHSQPVVNGDGNNGNGEGNERGAGVLSFGPFRLYVRARRLERDGQVVRIGSRAIDILVALTERAGDVLTRDELIAYVWPDVAVEESGLRVQIAGLRKALGDGQNGARYVTNVPGRGYTFVAPVSRIDAPVSADGPDVPSAPSAIPTSRAASRPGLPARFDRILGRDAAIREVSEQLLSRRFVSIVGPGGMGKTTVAVAVAHAMLPGFEGDVCFVDLGSLSDPRHVLLGVASALGLTAHGDDVAARLVAFLGDRRVLLVLDSCEHVMEAIAPIAERLRGQTAGVHILATSREALRVEGEHVYRLAALETPPERPEGDERDARSGVTAAEVLKFPAVQLFVERAIAGGVDISLSDDDAPVVADICRRLDGIALAIEFAAGRVGAFGIRGTASLLKNRFKLLWHGRRTALPRHRTLRALLDWSYDLLSDVERHVLRRLSVFVGFFSLDGVAALAEDAEGEHAVHTLSSLVEKSLVSMDAGGEEGARYRLLDTVRDYALAKLHEANEYDAAAKLHAIYMSTTLERENRAILSGRANTLAQYVGNVRVALNWAFSDTGSPETGTRLAAAATTMFLESSLLTECRQWGEIALNALHEADRGTRREMNLRAALAVAAMFSHGNSPEVRAGLARALELAEAVDDPYEQLRLLGAIHILCTRTAELREALVVAERSVEVSKRLMTPAATIVSSWMMGTTLHLLGAHEDAERYCRTTVDPSTVPKSAAMLHFGFDHRIRTLVVIARTRWLLGYPEEAFQVATRTIREAEELGQPTTVAIALIWMSSVFVWRGDHDVAADILERLAKYAEKHSLGPYRPTALALQAELAIKRGDFSVVEALRHNMDVLHAERHELLQTVFSTALAEGLAGLGQFDSALRTIDPALEMTDRNGRASYDLPEVLRVKGHLLVSKPAPDDAEGERYLLEALEAAKRQKALGWELRAAMTLARFWASRGRAAEARELVASVYGRFSQGFQTADLLAAKALLSEL
ncbi:helix-turn-helix transcriptional regulator [Pendulispora brunnea]|uniref:Helix-turn-helix transcriptional regulator n=1 Tax=Pendulispora brunnea TaxID=2905690 RepID=A0ABZ2KEV3_9BACT